MFLGIFWGRARAFEEEASKVPETFCSAFTINGYGVCLYRMLYDDLLIVSLLAEWCTLVRMRWALIVDGFCDFLYAFDLF